MSRVALPCQRGVAAIELAFICMIMVVMLQGLLVWWNYFQTHQIITRAVGDGVRIAQSLVAINGKQPCAVGTTANLHRSDIQSRVDEVVRTSLEQSALGVTALAPMQFQWTCEDAREGTLNLSLVWTASPIDIRENGVLHFKRVN